MDMQSPYQSPEEPDVFASQEPAGGTSPDEPELVFSNVEEFVTKFLVRQYARHLDPMGHDKEFTWCGSWWAHREAVDRLNGLWRAWESMRLDETTGMADWWIQYADPTMRALFYSNGPFKGCKPDSHAPTNKPLPSTPAPEGLFTSF